MTREIALHRHYGSTGFADYLCVRPLLEIVTVHSYGKLIN